MSVSIIEFTGFEAGQIKDAWSSFYENIYYVVGGASIESSVTRTGSYSLKIEAAADSGADAAYFGFHSNDGTVSSTNNAGTNNFYVAFALRVAVLPSSDDELIFRSVSTGTEGLHLRLDSDGHLNLYNSSDTLIASGTTELSTDTWYDIQFSQLYTGGAYDLIIDGTEEYSGTTSITNSLLTQIHFGRAVSKNDEAYTIYLDDIVVSEGGHIDRPFAVEALIPNGAGNYSDWTSGDYTDIDDVPMLLGGSDDYIQCGSTSAVHSCQCADTTLTGTFAAVKAEVMAKEGSNDSAKVFIRSGTTDYKVSVAKLLAGSYYPLGIVASTDPDTSAAWTESGVNAAEVGIDNSVGWGTGAKWGQGALHVLTAGEAAAGGAGWKIAYNFGG